MPSASDLLKQLVRLSQEANGIRDRAGRNVFDRVQIVAGLLADEQWVTKYHGVDTARDHLEVHYFPEVSLGVSLHRLLVALHELPAPDQWAALNWNLTSITNKAAAQRNEREAKPKPLPRPTKTEVVNLEREVEKAEAQKNEAVRTTETLRQQVARLERELSEARAEIERLKQKLDAARRGRRHPVGV